MDEGKVDEALAFASKHGIANILALRGGAIDHRIIS